MIKENSPQADNSGAQDKQINGIKLSDSGKHYDSDMLPSPFEYYRAEGIKFHRRTEWWHAKCQLCQSPGLTFLARIDSGAFKCTRCGKSGNNIAKFHMQKYNLTYWTALAAIKSRGHS